MHKASTGWVARRAKLQNWNNFWIKVCLPRPLETGGLTIPPDLEAVNLDNHEWSSDINNVTSVLKMWLRELPEPLMTFSLQQGFIEAASMCTTGSLWIHWFTLSEIENDRLRHIRLHERVNDLPDPNYATLKYLLGHLHRYSAFHSMLHALMITLFPYQDQSTRFREFNDESKFSNSLRANSFWTIGPHCRPFE